MKTYHAVNTPLVNACQYLEKTYRKKRYARAGEIPWDISDAIDILMEKIGEV